MENLFIDLLPAYVPFRIQTTKSDGTKIDPTEATVTIYENDGSGSSSVEVTGSPFTLTKIGSNTGFYGTEISIGLFTAGRFYHALYEATIDGIDSAYQESYFACNADSFKNYAAGSNRKEYIVYDCKGDPVSDVYVTVSTDDAGVNVIASNKTNPNGVALFYLPKGTLYLWRQKAGMTFDNPDVEVVE